MRDRWLYAAIAAAALALGGTLWLLERPAGAPKPVAPSIGPAALYAATFVDEAGQGQALGRFQGRVVLLNFWATWCAPCREEMPMLAATARRWADAGVTVVGLPNEPPETVAAFRARSPVGYPLWTGGAAVDALAKRLGDEAGVLPYSVLLGPDGTVLDQKVGPYSQEALEKLLSRYARKNG
jgi:thiol-disulfide isomerase/thioredoxin